MASKEEAKFDLDVRWSKSGQWVTLQSGEGEGEQGLCKRLCKRLLDRVYIGELALVEQ